ncbi:hypothetical protein [Sodalis-like endosymbiont of Proechinophthirus fluctus]
MSILREELRKTRLRGLAIDNEEGRMFTYASFHIYNRVNYIE